MSVDQPRNLAASVHQRLLNIAKRALSKIFSSDAVKQTQWKAFLRKNALQTDDLAFAGIITALHDFLMPPILPNSTDIKFDAVWSPGGPWRF